MVVSPSDWWNIGLMDFLVLGLATWRLTSLLVKEDGPWDLFARLRSSAGVKFDAHSEPYAETFFGSLLMCVWCTSVWVGGFLALAFLLAASVTLILCLPFALSAFTISLQRMHD